MQRSALDDIFFIFPVPLSSGQKGCLTDTVRLPTAAGSPQRAERTGAVSGMNSGINPVGLFLVAAFLSALIHQAAIAASLFALLRLVRGASRNWLPAIQAAPPGAGPQGRPR
jgi:hypothetical protein